MCLAYIPQTDTWYRVVIRESLSSRPPSLHVINCVAQVALANAKALAHSLPTLSVLDCIILDST
jgi:hypothetical protein